MPDLATVVPVFNVESIERPPGTCSTAARAAGRVRERRLQQALHRDRPAASTTRSPCASCSAPRFLDWTTRIPAEVDFGITDRQLFFHWRLRERTKEELKEALHSAGGIFERLQREMEENDLDIYQPGPWNAGLEPFPPKIGLSGGHVAALRLPASP